MTDNNNKSDNNEVSDAEILGTVQPVQDYAYSQVEVPAEFFKPEYVTVVKSTLLDPKKVFFYALLFAFLGGLVGLIGGIAVAKPVMQRIEGIQGPVGPVGPQGEQGERGPAGPQGVKGDKGNTGDTGLQGPAGQDGVVSSLSAVPGWPANCASPSVKTVTVQINGADTNIQALVCG